MISLSVEEKCQNCPNFRPGLEVIDITTLEDIGNGMGRRLSQTIYCENESFCKQLEDYLKQETEEEKK